MGLQTLAWSDHYLQDTKISRDDDDVCQLRPGVTWVVTTALRNHFPIGLSFSLCSCRKGEERREEREGKKKREKQQAELKTQPWMLRHLEITGHKALAFLASDGYVLPS